MREATFFVMPSYSETFSLVCIEALACGLPVVATQCGGPDDIVTEELGILVPPKDIRALTAAIDYMAAHLNDYPSPTLARKVLCRFGSQSFSKRFLEIIYNDISQRKK